MISQQLIDLMGKFTEFDPSNAEHRRLAAVYLKSRSWAHTDTRFVVSKPYTNVVTLITTKLATYYSSLEFKDLYETAVTD